MYLGFGFASNPFLKSVGTVSFIPLEDMTEEDWEVLDYDGLRETAKNRLAAKIVTGDLEGFFDVRLLEKAKAKNRYLWPADEEDIVKYGRNDHSFFKNTKNADDFVTQVDVIEGARNSFGFFTKAAVLTGLAVLAAKVAQEHNEDEQIEQIVKGLELIHPNQFSIVAAIAVGKVAKALNTSYEEAAEELVEWLQKNREQELDSLA